MEKRFENANQAWEFWYKELLGQANHGFVNNSRDGDVAGEILNAVTIIDDPTRNIVTSDLRKLPMRYAVGELLWYLSGSNLTCDIAQFSKVWNKLSDDGVHANSAYGYRIAYKFGFNQWDWVKSELVDNPQSRRAVIHIKDADDRPTKDMPCTCLLQFIIREEKLNLTVYMRSNDIWTGMPYDIFAFTCMQIKMAMELGFEVGTYTHIAASLHLYKRNLPKDFEPDSTEEPVEETIDDVLEECTLEEAQKEGYVPRQDGLNFAVKVYSFVERIPSREELETLPDKELESLAMQLGILVMNHKGERASKDRVISRIREALKKVQRDRTPKIPSKEELKTWNWNRLHDFAINLGIPEAKTHVINKKTKRENIEKAIKVW